MQTNSVLSFIQPKPHFLFFKRTAVHASAGVSTALLSFEDTSDVTPLSEYLYEELMEKEPLLPIENIQGDSVLGFNKRFTRRLVLNITDSSSKSLASVKNWIQDYATVGIKTSSGNVVKITSLEDILSHRIERRIAMAARKSDSNAMKMIEETVQTNICFSYSCLNKLLLGTAYEDTMPQFHDKDPFVIGAWKRGALLGDRMFQDKYSYDFGKGGNDDMLINLASDSQQAIDDAVQGLTTSFAGLLTVVDDTFADRGVKGNDPLYGHEHFGFQDGLSQPEV
ncbi:hypothetical protein ACA910_010916 [Epithemia clementina (nom. ined.)]